MNLYSPDLGIGQLSRATGVTISTLRAWERRYGFPVAARLDSGHRRYSGRDVESIRAVIRDRQSGTSLVTALASAKAQAYGPRPSVFGVLRRAMPDIAPAIMSKPSLVLLSRAIEDEIASRAERPLLMTAFQQERFWRASEPRWRNLVPISSVTVVMASVRRASHRGALWLVPLPADAPLHREWVVICDSPTFSACLAAVELPDSQRRSFEVLWSAEPAMVREAARVAAAIASTQQPDLAALLGDHLRVPPATGYDVVRATTSLTNRIVGYLAPSERVT